MLDSTSVILAVVAIIAFAITTNLFPHSKQDTALRQDLWFELVMVGFIPGIVTAILAYFFLRG